MRCAPLISTRFTALSLALAAVGLIGCEQETTSPNSNRQEVSESKAVVPAHSMAGEEFSAVSRVGEGDGPGEVRITAVSCEPGSASVSFIATGPATGPYPGTFVEVGTITAGPRDAENSRFTTSFEAEYTIRSKVGTVKGTKHMTAPGQFGCSGEGEHTQISVGSIRTVYQAHIRARSARCFDAGTARTEFGHFPGDVTAFNEAFETGNNPPACRRGNGP